MNLYLVLDLSVSLAQNVDHEKCVKIQRAFRFAETLITEIDKNEVTVHLIYLAGLPIMAKAGINDASLVRSSFENTIVSKTNQSILVASDYKALRDLITSHKTSYNYEVLIVTDLSEEIPFPNALKLPCLLRFVFLTDFNSEYLSESLVATLECVSLSCGLEAMFAQSVEELDSELHFPFMLGDYTNEIELAKVLGQEERTVKDVTITLNQSITLKATLFPGLPKRLVVMDEEMLYRQMASAQSPTFKFVGAAQISTITKFNSTALTFEVCPRVGESQQNTDAFRKLFDALIETSTVAVLAHSSGEECYLRPLKFNNSDETCALVMQFYASQYVDWKGPQDQPAPVENPHQFSYKSYQLYWNDVPDAQTDINKLCRRLKKETNLKPFFEEFRTICEFAIASGFSEFSSTIAHLIEKRAAAQDVANNPNIVAIIQWLRAPNGLQTASTEISKLLNAN